MKKLIRETAAYKTFAHDGSENKFSHAYMLFYNDQKNMLGALKLFALEFFGEDENTRDGKRILNGSFPDCRIYPEPGQKLNKDAANDIVSESALQSVERDKKLFVLSGFNEAAPLVQNKLLKTLEEPLSGVYFLLGATTLAPVLETVKSRVKTLTVPPFTEEEILAALDREGANPLNAKAAKSCGGVLGVAQNMVSGSWFAEVEQAARTICTTTKLKDIGKVAAKYGDSKRKEEILAHAALLFSEALKDKVNGKHNEIAALWQTPALVYALESIDKASGDLKFNAVFLGLLYDLMLKIITENNKWLKLQQ